MRVLLVGGRTGYLGRAVAEALESQGAEVVALSRRTPSAQGVIGDVTRGPELGLSGAQLEDLRSSVTHVVSGFGSVSWSDSPRDAVGLHRRGTENVLGFAARCRHFEQGVHVSSVLVLGRAAGRAGNRHLHIGQRFRSWYEYGKYLAESVVREAGLPWRVVRLGPLLGPADGRPPAVEHGILAALPVLLQGYPVHVHRRGTAPCYVGPVVSAAEVVARAARDPVWPPTTTWYDPRAYTLGEVYTGLAAAWGVVPRIVDAPVLGKVLPLVSRRLGAPAPLLRYAEPWTEIDPSVLDELPGPAVACPPHYLEETGQLLRADGASLARVG